MPEPLWKIRQRKGMNVNQLAAKSGVPAISIIEYEAGHSIRSADLPKLAKALYVEEWDIEIQSKARPKAERPRKPSPDRPKDAKPPAAKKRAPPPLARPSQIEHLLTLTTHNFDKDRAALEEEVGKPLEELTRPEASDLLKQYQKLLAESRPTMLPGEARSKRKRAYLPEGVDEFELQYLTAQQETGARLRFTLFDGRDVSGHIIGFSPYSITIKEESSGDEVTLQKLAIAYYRVVAGAQASETGSISRQPAEGKS